MVNNISLSLISINYNNLEGLQKTLDSVVAQTRKDFEWIVIDGGSSDGSRELIEQNQDAITYWCSERDRGIFHALNKGVAQAKGDYCLFLNSGDILHDNKVVEMVLPFLSGDDFITGNECVVNPDYSYVRTRRNPDVFYAYCLLVGCLWHQSTFIRTSLLKERPFDESFKIVGDWETSFYWLVLCKRTYKHIDLIISDFVLGGISTDLKTAGEESWRTIDKRLSHRQQDLIALEFFSMNNTEENKRKMSETAYTAFANNFYTQQEYEDIFASYHKELVNYSSIHHRLFNYLCLSGYMNFAKLLYKCINIIKQK